MASLGKSVDAKRAVAVHILFNTAGVMLWFFFIPHLADLVREISHHAGHLENTSTPA